MTAATRAGAHGGRPPRAHQGVAAAARTQVDVYLDGALARRHRRELPARVASRRGRRPAARADVLMLVTGGHRWARRPLAAVCACTRGQLAASCSGASG
jgi:hypothetical protein